MSKNAHESKVEMVISTVVFTSVFWTFYSASVIYIYILWFADVNRSTHTTQYFGEEIGESRNTF